MALFDRPGGRWPVRLLGTRGRGPPRRVVPSQNGNASGTCAWVYDNSLYGATHVCLSETYCSVEYPRQLERRTKGMVAVRKWFGGGTRVVQATMRTIAPSMPPHVCPRQGRRRPSPSFCAAGTGGVATAENYGGARPPRQCAPSPQACPHTSAPGRAAGGPRRVFVPQAQAA